VKKLPVLIALLLFTSLECPAQQLAQAAEQLQNPWQLWKDNSQQSVSYRPAVIEKGNNTDNHSVAHQLIEIKATAKVYSSISGFLTFIQDVDNTPNWLVNASNSKVIKQYSIRENSFYITLAKIWPLQARILLLHSTYWQNADLSVEIKLTDDLNNNTDYLTEIDVKEYLPVKIHSAHWKITPTLVVSDDKTKTALLIEYVFIADGRGDTPKWLADHLALKSIWKSMKNIRRLLPDEQWQHQQAILGITELTAMPISSTLN